MRSPRRRRFNPFNRSRLNPVGRGMLSRLAEGTRTARSALQSKFLAADGTAVAAMPANASLARLLAAHVLRDGEIVLLILRPSIFFILLSSLRFVAAAGVLMMVVHWQSLAQHGMVRALIELGVSAISARLMWGTIQWMSRLYVLTDQRILSVIGVFHVNIFDCPLRKVARTRLIRSAQDKLTGVGSIEIVPQDESLAFGVWETVNHPFAVHDKIVATINRAKQGGMLCD